MRYLNYAKAAFFLALIVLCVGCCNKKLNPKTALDFKNERISVFLIAKTVEVVMPSLDTPSDTSEEVTRVPLSVSTGTGASVRSNKNYSDILTAGHVCADMEIPEVFGDQHVTTFTLVDFTGRIFNGDLIAIDHEADLCLLRIYTPTRAAQISEKELASGDPVWYSGYPLGIYNPYTLHHFSGYFSGSDADGFYMYSLPAAPGASGSPIFDKDQKLVGVVSAIPEDFSHLTIGAGTQRIKAFLFLTSDCTKFCVKP